MKFRDITELNESVEIDHEKYMASHGKKAKGTGNWMFEVEGKKFSPGGSLSLTAAASKAAKMAKEAGIKHVYRVTVLP